ncbi:porin [Rhodalgimonas zhirmunskyi]|uniref:Porin n=1 Tax=Rhodalgimonas zhirmunskyi TaxID=2964767 RepID=A0AAJ1UCU2_9RHOB|nr:porin [Rhodoalgimonas zhirmunskyi]MDQ2093812.1 porin [Rhodoalgimonas zhirmunskyi]
MNMKLVVAAGMAIAIPATLQADDWNGVVTLGYSQTDIGGTGADASAGSLDFNGVYNFDTGFSLGFDASLVVADISNGGGDMDLNYLALNGEYKLQNGVTFGGYIERGEVDDNGLLLGNARLTSYGLTFGYEVENLDAEAYIGASDTSPSLGGGTDINDFGVRVGYQISPQAFMVGSLARSEISNTGVSVDIDMIALGGGYAFNNQWSVYGGVQRISVDAASLDETTYGLGVAYSPAAISAMPMTLSLELARTDVDLGGASSDLDTVRLGLTVPLGNTKKNVPANSVVNNIAKGGHNVVTSGFLGAF